MAEELAFLSLECVVLDAPWVAAAFWDAYARATGDQMAEPLKAFYQSSRAVLRALLAMRHLLEEPYRGNRQYLLQAQKYLHQAELCTSVL